MNVAQIVQITRPNGPAINFSRVSATILTRDARLVVAPGATVTTDAVGALLVCAEMSGELKIVFGDSSLIVYPFFVINFSTKNPCAYPVNFVNDLDRTVELYYAMVFP